MTTPASAACGISAMNGDRNNAASTAASALATPDKRRARAGHAIHRGLRRAATRGHGAQESAHGIGGAGGQQLGIRTHQRIVGARKGAADGDGFGEAHERDAERARPHGLRQRQVRQPERWQSRRHRARPRTRPWLCSAQMAVAAMAAPSTINGAGHFGPEFLDQRQHRDGAEADDHGDQHGLRNAPTGSTRRRGRILPCGS